MRSNAIPAEFEDLLNASGRRVLAGTHALCGALANPRVRFLARHDLVWEDLPREWHAGAFIGNGLLGSKIWASGTDMARHGGWAART